MIKFLVPSRLSLCFQNEIELSFSKPKSYKYHLHNYVKFDRNRINLYPFLLHVIVTLTLDILCRSSQEKPTFFIFLLMLLLSLNPHKKQMEQSNYSVILRNICVYQPIKTVILYTLFNVTTCNNILTFVITLLSHYYHGILVFRRCFD